MTKTVLRWDTGLSELARPELQLKFAPLSLEFRIISNFINTVDKDAKVVVKDVSLNK